MLGGRRCQPNVVRIQLRGAAGLVSALTTRIPSGSAGRDIDGSSRVSCNAELGGPARRYEEMRTFSAAQAVQDARSDSPVTVRSSVDRLGARFAIAQRANSNGWKTKLGRMSSSAL